MSKYLFVLLSFFALQSLAEPSQLAESSQAESSQEDASSKLVDALGGMNTLAGKFKQTITDDQGEVMQVTEGEFKVKRPGYFLWQVAPPYEQLVVGTPSSLKVYDPDLEQMTVHAQDSLAGTPAALISSGAESIADSYDVSHKAQKTIDTYTMVQKSAQNNGFASLSFSFVNKGKAPVLSEMVFVDQLGQSTLIKLSDVTLNPEIAFERFSFNPPEGTDIIVDG